MSKKQNTTPKKVRIKPTVNINHRGETITLIGDWSEPIDWPPKPGVTKIGGPIDPTQYLRQRIREIKDGRRQLDLFQESSLVSRLNRDPITNSIETALRYVDWWFSNKLEPESVFDPLKELLAIIKDTPPPPVLKYDLDTFKEQAEIMGYRVTKEHETRPGVWRIDGDNGGWLQITINDPETQATLGNLPWRVMHHMYSRSRQIGSLYGVVSDKDFLHDTGESGGKNLKDVSRCLRFLPKASFSRLASKQAKVITTAPFFSIVHELDSPPDSPKEKILVYRWNPDYLRLVGKLWLMDQFDPLKEPDAKYISVPRESSLEPLSTPEMNFTNWLRRVPPGAKKFTLEHILLDVCHYPKTQVNTKAKRKTKLGRLCKKAIDRHLISEYSILENGRTLKKKYLAIKRTQDVITSAKTKAKKAAKKRKQGTQRAHGTHATPQDGPLAGLADSVLGAITDRADHSPDPGKSGPRELTDAERVVLTRASVLAERQGTPLDADERQVVAEAIRKHGAKTIRELVEQLKASGGDITKAVIDLG